MQGKSRLDDIINEQIESDFTTRYARVTDADLKKIGELFDYYTTHTYHSCLEDLRYLILLVSKAALENEILKRKLKDAYHRIAKDTLLNNSGRVSLGRL